MKVSEKTRSKLHTTIDGSKALDVAIKEVSHHPEVQFHMLPLPTYGAVAGASSAGDPRATPYHPVPDYGGKGKTKDKGKGKEKGAGKGKRVVPHGCSIKFGENGKPICMKFNVGACRANIKAGKRCVHGYHVCWKDNCNKPCAFHECTHKV